MSKFAVLKPSDSRGQAYDSKKSYKSEISSINNGTVNLKNLDFNSEYSDFGSVCVHSNLLSQQIKTENNILSSYDA